MTREEGGTSEGGCAKRVARRPARLVSRGEARANHEHPPPGPLESWSGRQRASHEQSVTFVYEDGEVTR